MSDLFMKFWEMALEGSIVLLSVMLIRFVLKKVPKKYMCFLWMIAILRLCVPYLPQGPIPAFWRAPKINESTVGQETVGELSAIQDGQFIDDGTGNAVKQATYAVNGNAAEPLTYVVNENAAEPLTYAVNGNAAESLTYAVDGNTAEPLTYNGNRNDTEQFIYAVNENATEQAAHITKPAFSVIFGLVWLLGAIVALVRFGLQYYRISSRLQESVPIGRFQNYIVKEHPLPGLPAVLGVFHPCIYVPINFAAWEENQKELILLHEATHIRRGDHLLKLFSIFILCMYWWNPIVWIGVKLLHCDIEMACDEGVLAGRNEDSREAYAKVLLFHAVRGKQIALPIAFGENHTEGRIKNILRYRKTSIVVSAALILLVGVLVICIGTKPRDVATKTAEEMMESETIEAETDITAETSPEATNLSPSDVTETQTWWDLCKNYWTERLAAEGKVKNPDEDMFFLEDCVQLPGDIGDMCSRLSMQVIVVDEDGNLSLYQSFVDLPNAISKAYRVEDAPTSFEGINTVHEELSVIDREDILWRLEDIYCSRYVYVKSQESIPGENEEERMFYSIAELLKARSPENYKLLRDPGSAVELLLHLKGSAEKFVYDQHDTGYLIYHLADGSQLNFLMHQDSDGWFPVDFLNMEWEHDPDQKERDLKLIAQRETEASYLAKVSADTLRKINRSAEDGMPKSEWYDHLENDFVIISKPKNEEAKNVDATLYGTYGGNSMVLRVGEKVMPIYIHWTSPQLILPELYCGDYDGDGEMEYAIKTHFKTGTGVSGDQLYIVELLKDTYKMYNFFAHSLYRQLECIDYTYDSEKHIITVHNENGEDASLYIGDYLTDCCGYDGTDDPFSRLVFGDIEKFYLQDNCWYYSAEGGIKIKYFSQPQYECSVEVTCPVSYSESEGFLLGEMQYKIINEYEK